MHLPKLCTADLQALSPAILQTSAPHACSVCAPLACRGWESVPSGFDRGALQRIGTLCDEDSALATVAEYHPQGTHAWSADAPIAPAYYPYNRCDVWQCVACARPFLRYTEYGGYYLDERIRELSVALVCDAVPPPPAP